MCNLAIAPLLLATLGILPLPANPSDDLFAAAKQGDLQRIERLLAHGADVNAKTAYGATALHYAADRGNLEAVKLLLKHQANPNAKDSFYGTTPLAWALLNNHFEVATALVESGSKDLDTGLLLAARARQPALVKLILQKSKPSATTLAGALSLVTDRHPEVALILKQAGAKTAIASRDAPLSAAALHRFEGSYGNEAGVEYTVVSKDGNLILQLGSQCIYVFKSAGKTIFTSTGDEDAKLVFKETADKVVGMSLKAGDLESQFQRLSTPQPAFSMGAQRVDQVVPSNWPSFRGPLASGIADGQQPPISWDVDKGTNIRWKTAIPGLGHSSPVIWGDRLFVTTAISGDPKAGVKPGLYGDVTSVNDSTVH